MISLYTPGVRQDRPVLGIITDEFYGDAVIYDGLDGVYYLTGPMLELVGSQFKIALKAKTDADAKREGLIRLRAAIYAHLKKWKAVYEELGDEVKTIDGEFDTVSSGTRLAQSPTKNSMPTVNVPAMQGAEAQ